MEDITVRQLEVFFDYACPYCLAGHGHLMQLLPKHTDIEVVWRPCEAHPRPEVRNRYSDKCIESLFFAMDSGANLTEFNQRMYDAAQKDNINIEDPDALASYFTGLLDPAAYRDALTSCKYAQAALDANDYAYEQSEVWVIPAYRMDGRKLDAAAGVGVTAELLADFLNAN